MAGDPNGERTQEELQAQEDLGQQAQEEQSQMSGVDWEKAIAERDERITALEQQVADTAKNAEAAEVLRGEIAELKAQGESDRIDFKLQLAGVRSIKTACAVLDNHGGYIGKLKEAEPWLFTDAPARRQGERPGFPTRARARTRARRSNADVDSRAWTIPTRTKEGR